MNVSMVLSENHSTFSEMYFTASRIVSFSTGDLGPNLDYTLSASSGIKNATVPMKLFPTSLSSFDMVTFVRLTLPC